MVQNADSGTLGRIEQRSTHGHSDGLGDGSIPGFLIVTVRADGRVRTPTTAVHCAGFVRPLCSTSHWGRRSHYGVSGLHRRTIQLQATWSPHHRVQLETKKISRAFVRGEYDIIFPVTRTTVSAYPAAPDHLAMRQHAACMPMPRYSGFDSEISS